MNILVLKKHGMHFHYIYVRCVKIVVWLKSEHGAKVVSWINHCDLSRLFPPFQETGRQNIYTKTALQCPLSSLHALQRTITVEYIWTQVYPFNRSLLHLSFASRDHQWTVLHRFALKLTHWRQTPLHSHPLFSISSEIIYELLWTLSSL